jgi:5-formyltetrahydrofolate cyclo-ligase
MRLFAKGRRIAVYNAIDGEIDLSPVIEAAQRAHCALYEPRIVDMRTRKMEFVALARRVGKFSAVTNRRIDPRDLDVVLVPLVAFDLRGWRLGFGAGFYDRKFAFLRRGFRIRPLLIGVGYEFQRMPPQQLQSWDVALRAVVTEQRWYRCGASISDRRATP